MPDINNIDILDKRVALQCAEALDWVAHRDTDNTPFRWLKHTGDYWYKPVPPLDASYWFWELWKKLCEIVDPLEISCGIRSYLGFDIAQIDHEDVDKSTSICNPCAALCVAIKDAKSLS